MELVMSFNRAQYRTVFEFARAVALYHESRDELETRALEIMEAVEAVIGQQSDFPEMMRQRHV
jgi:hypothetical protein